MQLPTFITRSLGFAAYEFARLQPFIPTYLHLLASALFPIYAGAHSSLSRPSSAAKRQKGKTNKGAEDEDEQDDEGQKMEGLSPTDALMFPVLAGCTLTGLYFLIKWLNDPALLNKILNWYFAGFSVFSVSKLVSDGLDVLHSMLFPHDYVDRNQLYHVDWRKRQAVSATDPSHTRATPLPGFLSRLLLPQAMTNVLWTLHVLPNRRLQVKAIIRKILYAKLPLGIHGIEGFAVGLSTVLWYNFVSKPWALTNLMGFGFAYGTLQLLSPTTFWTGTMILSGLFFYDIYFVFFTPMMVTVAKSLDIPIKLLFPRPPSPDDPSSTAAMSMLGLGDVVLPGIMIGLALRFDLYMHFLKKQSKRPQLERKKSNGSDGHDEQSSDEDKDSVVKAPYKSVAEGWGDRLWTSSLLTGNSRSHGYTARNAFPKPYFHAGMTGYLVGMLATLGAMQISEHAQPALLYLVPGVLSCLWGTAWWRGEVDEMWSFSEATEEEKDEKSKGNANEAESEHEAKGENMTSKQRRKSANSSFFSAERSEARAKRLDKAMGGKEDEVVAKGITEGEIVSKEDDQTLFLFSVTLPPPPKPSRTDETNEEDESAVRYNLSSKDAKSPERAGKRQRLS